MIFVVSVDISKRKAVRFLNLICQNTTPIEFLNMVLIKFGIAVFVLCDSNKNIASFWSYLFATE